MGPKYVPVFLQIMALPPFVDDDNLQIFLSILMDDHVSKGQLKKDMYEHVSKRRQSNTTNGEMCPLTPRLETHISSDGSGVRPSTKEAEALTAVAELATILEN